MGMALGQLYRSQPSQMYTGNHQPALRWCREKEECAQRNTAQLHVCVIHLPNSPELWVNEEHAAPAPRCELVLPVVPSPPQHPVVPLTAPPIHTDQHRVSGRQTHLSCLEKKHH